jgi:hypothetical protein
MTRLVYGILIFSMWLSSPLSLRAQSNTTPTTITCDEVFRFQSRCASFGSIQTRIGLNNKFHTGEFMQITIDGIVHDVEVDPAGLGKVTVDGFAPGIHMTELIYPGGCYPAIEVHCNGHLDKWGDEWEDDALVAGNPSPKAVLLDNYPDPFNPSTTIRYSLGEEGHVTLTVYNMLGQAVKTLVDQFESAGSREVIWDGSNDLGQKVASGMYLYRISVVPLERRDLGPQGGDGSAGNFTATKRMFLLK